MRKLSDEEQGLWDRLKQTVRPLPRRRGATKNTKTEMKIAADAPPPPPAKREKKAKQAAATPPKSLHLQSRHRQRSRRSRKKPFADYLAGLLGIDDKIDLHGMRQERAHAALGAFLRRSQTRGDRVVLVVTGKGASGEEGRGVLRGAVPGWLSQPELRELVVGFEEAARRHGGSGALYVRIRRRREARLRAARA